MAGPTYYSKKFEKEYPIVYGVNPNSNFTCRNAVYIFDIDNCISDDEWRLPLIEGVVEGSPHADYDKYHEGIDNDTPIVDNAEFLKLILEKDVNVVFATARPEKYRKKTSMWLEHYFAVHRVKATVYLMMRSNDDLRGSVEIKRDMLAVIRSASANIEHAYDDRNDICLMYEENGVRASVLDKKGLRDPVKVAASDVEHLQSPNNNPQASLKNTIDEVSKFFSKIANGNAVSDKNASDILASASETFRERNANYKDNAALVGQVMALFFPNGITIKTAEDHHFYHLFELQIVKLTRFVKSGLKHKDSMHDLMVYAAMIELLIDNHDIKIG